VGCCGYNFELALIFELSESISVFRVGISFLKSCFSALKELLSHFLAKLRFSGIGFEATIEYRIVIRTLSLDNEHTGSIFVLPGEPDDRESNTQYPYFGGGCFSFSLLKTCMTCSPSYDSNKLMLNNINQTGKPKSIK
jgi:hypothetical protein